MRRGGQGRWDLEETEWAAREEKTQPGPRLGGWEESVKALSPFKAAGTQAPSPAQAWRGRGPGMLLRPQKDCSFPEEQTPTPTPALSLPCQPSPVLCKGKVEGATEGCRGERSPTN